MDKPSLLSLLLLFAILIASAVRIEGAGGADMRCSSMYKSLGYVGQSHFFYMAKKVDWHEANRTCHSYPNTHLATFPDEYTLHVITERTVPMIGRTGMKTSFWFGAYELMFDKWRWLDDQIYDGHIVDYDKGVQNTKKTCGLVDVANTDNLAFATCITGRRFLCVNPDDSLTNPGTNNYYISTTAEAVTWFRAREICLCRGMDLAKAKDGSVDYIYTILNGSTNQFWIGLQKARFVWENTREAIDYLPFRPKQPSAHDVYGTYEDCLHVVEGGYNDMSCGNKHNFVCEQENVSNLPYSNSATETPKVTNQYQSEPTKKAREEMPRKVNTGNAGIVAAVVISVLVVVAVIAVAVAILVRRSTNSNTGNRWMRFRDNRGDEGL